MAQWLHVELTVAAADEERAGVALLALGAEGYEVQDSQTFLTTAPGQVRLVTYLAPEQGPPESLRARLLQQLDLGATPAAALPPAEAATPARVRVELVGDPGWAEAWKRFFRPIPIGTRLLVRPPWEAVDPAEPRRVLTLDPGLAFGTGNHPTTRLCLELLAAAPPQPLLDVGCGSGILAIAAVLLGAPRATGIDNDPEAVLVARENATINGIAAQTDFSATPLAAVVGTFPLVVANILSGTLLQLAPDLVARVAPGGRLILSGILLPESPTVVAAYAQLGCHLLEQREELGDGGDHWATLLLGVPGSAGEPAP